MDTFIETSWLLCCHLCLTNDPPVNYDDDDNVNEWRQTFNDSVAGMR